MVHTVYICLNVSYNLTGVNQINYSSEDCLHKSTIIDLLDLGSRPIMPDSSLAMARSRK
jgi:hypothetical protein